jgi:hypothetical protein
MTTVRIGDIVFYVLWGPTGWFFVKAMEYIQQ